MCATYRDRSDEAFEDLPSERHEVLLLLARGLGPDAIARSLDLPPNTVRLHVAALLTQLDVTSPADATSAYVAWEAKPAQLERVMQRPAIAVLPLLAAGDDPRTRTLASGLTEDLASLFARWCWFPVIATTSTADARSLGRTTGEIGGALGARFVVDGDVRTIGPGVRVSLRIADAATDAVLWSEQRDFVWDAFARTRDALCHEAVAAAYPALVSRAMTCPSIDRFELAAWELAHEGMARRARREREANASALRRFHEALSRDPALVLAHFGIGLAAYDALLNQWGPKDRALEALERAARSCLDHAPHAAEGHYLRGRYLQSLGDWEQAIRPLEDAIGHNPSFALAHACLSQSLQATGRAAESLVRMQHAVRLGPRSFQAGLSTLHFMQSEYDDALASAEIALLTTPRYPFARALAAASAFWLGDLERARTHVRALHEVSPTFAPSGFAATFGKQVDAVDRLTQALDAMMRAS